MKERPILFSAPMVRAILAGTKTQTRRIVKPLQSVACHQLNCIDGVWWPIAYNAGTARPFRCPYGQPGDRLWVRETWCREFEGGYLYRADDISGSAPDFVDGNGDPTERSVWKPSIHMPRWASRITLEITGVRVERLREISQADAVAEGVDNAMVGKAAMCKSFVADPLGWPCSTWVGGYRWLWESINGTDSWTANPWVWVVEFRRLP